MTERAIARPHWYALRIRSNHEASVALALEAAGIEQYAPTWCELVRWSDREKRVVRPMFPGYGFARFDASRQLIEILQTRGVAGVLGASEYSPEPIDDAEIHTLQKIVDAAATSASPCAYVAGDAVTVETGPLAGVSGVVTRTKGATRLVVRIEILKRAVSVEIDADTVAHAAKAS